MYNITYTKLAEDDTYDALSYYLSIDIELYNKLVLNINKIESFIKVSPEIYRIRYGNKRRANLRDFPLCVYFEILESEVIILRVLHQRQDPILWP